MKIAIIGSRNVTVDNEVLSKYVSPTDEIVSGGAKGVDSCARDFAKKKGIGFTEFLPEYSLYGRAAPIRRNEKIVDYADKIIAFWDGESRGTLSTIKYAKKLGKECEIIICKNGEP